MIQPEPLIRNIADTARWAAVYRARETERADALFRDPLARRLAGERGEEIAAAIPFSNKHTWSWITRTYLFDQFLREQIQQGVEMVVNLAAGLDARPYRMDLPAALLWVEVDLPEMVAYKDGILAGEQPRCSLERVPLDLSQVAARRQLFERLGRQSSKALVLTEGLIIYFTADQVAELCARFSGAAQFPALGDRSGVAGLGENVATQNGTQAERRQRQVTIWSQRRTGVFQTVWLEAR